jgi:uncharacterized protein
MRYKIVNGLERGWVVYLILSAGIAGLVVYLLSSSGKAKMTATVSDYEKSGAFEVNQQTDRYIRTTTVKHKIETDNNRSGGGGSRGGSHTSSGGHSHGGGGRGF